MKITITTDLGPYLDNKPLPMGAEVDVDAETAAAFIEKGFAEEVKGKAAAKKAEPQPDPAADV